MADDASARARLGAALEERIALLAPARRLRLAVVLAALERRATRQALRVLDAGCGDGLLALEIAHRHRSWEIIGVDLRDELLATARDRAGQRQIANVRFEHADLTEPPAETGFDAVIAIECLEEIPDDHSAVDHFAAALAPGGTLIAHVPERSWRPILRGSAATWRDEVRHGYTAAEITALFQDAGLSEIELEPTYRGTVALAQELRDRIKDRRVATRALAYPAMVAAVRLERLGATWGPPHALLVTAARR
jgi:SAM-dependent methyltransferase